jgi:hypothetical protein
MQSLAGNKPEDKAGCLFHDGINRIQIITLPKNRDSSVFRSVAKSPYPLRYPSSETHQRSLWFSPFSKNLAARYEQIYFILSFLKSQKKKNTKATKSCFTQNYRIILLHDNLRQLTNVASCTTTVIQTACVECPPNSCTKVYFKTAAIISKYITG